MTEPDWANAPRGATHYAVGSQWPWERRSPTNRGYFARKDHDDQWLWVCFTTDYATEISLSSIPRIPKSAWRPNAPDS
jgi:hypothetical protein